MASEYAHCYGGDASREYLSVEDATSNGGDASRVGIETKVKCKRYYC